MKRIDKISSNRELRYEPENRDWSKQHEQITTYVFRLGETKFEDEGTVVVVVEKESGKAVQYSFKYIENDYPDMPTEEKVWLPKSQIKETEDGIEIPVWLSEKKRLGNYVFTKKVIRQA